MRRLPDDLSAEQRAAMRTQAQQTCTHPDQWVSHAPPFTTDACWECLLDAYFDVARA